MAGFARTGLFREVFHVAEGENPYELEIRIIDDLKSGEIVVFGCGGSERIAPWGELLTTAARARGAVGAVTELKWYYDNSTLRYLWSGYVLG